MNKMVKDFIFWSAVIAFGTYGGAVLINRGPK